MLSRLFPSRTFCKDFVARPTSRPCRAFSSSPPRQEKSKLPEADEYALPLQPTWSVNGLLSSYPKPSITPSTLNHLHHLSALIPPAEATQEHQRLTRELEALVKLVEAVKLVHIKDHASSGATTIPDGRVCADSARIDLSDHPEPPELEDAMDQGSLLAHAARTEEGMYVVDVERPHTKSYLQYLNPDIGTSKDTLFIVHTLRRRAREVPTSLG